MSGYLGNIRNDYDSYRRLINFYHSNKNKFSESIIFKILKEFKEKHADEHGILLISVFGSVARGQATKKNDVDIFLKTKTPDPFNIVHIKEELEEKLHQHVDIVRLRDRMNSSLKNRIEKEAVYA